MEAEQFTMRAPCKACKSETGKVVQNGGQNVVRCYWCGTFAYNAPKTETGERKRSVTTVHNGIKPKQRARVFLRANARCEFCGIGAEQTVLHVQHLISVDDGIAEGLTDDEINHMDNLAALCEECNLGLSKQTVPLLMILRLTALRLGIRRATA
jgi:hypothetical protein